MLSANRGGSKLGDMSTTKRTSAKRPRAGVKRRKVSGTAKGTGRPEVVVTHAEKVFFPEAGVSKGEVIEYYERIASRLLPHLRGRPATLERLPDGVGEGRPRFWQKNTPDYYPEWIPRVRLPSGNGPDVNYVLIDRVETLAYLANQGALTFHVWLSRVGSLDEPDYVLFDLDRSGASFGDVVKVARALREELDGEKVDSYPKTSGKSGLHVLVPWGRGGGYEAARAWAMGVAGRVVERLPDLATTERMKAERGSRVYVDVIQNARGHHVVPPYVLRAVGNATVSTPLAWEEVNGRLRPERFTMKAVLARVKKQRGDLMAGLVEGW